MQGTAEMFDGIGIQAMQMLGRLTDGAERDHGKLYHAVPINDKLFPLLFHQNKALCGAKPGRRSVGWQKYEGHTTVTCPRCLRRMKTI